MSYAVEITADDLVAQHNATEIRGTPTWLEDPAIMCAITKQDQIPRCCYAHDRFEFQILMQMHPFTPKRWFILDKKIARSLCGYTG